MECSLGGLIKPREENSTPETLKAVQVTLVKPVAYLKCRVTIQLLFTSRLAFLCALVHTPSRCEQPQRSGEGDELEKAVSIYHRLRRPGTPAAQRIPHDRKLAPAQADPRPCAAERRRAHDPR